MVPLEPLAPHPSLPVLYHSSTTNSLLLGRARLGSSTLSCMLTRPLSLMSQAGRTLDVAPMGSQLGRGGTLLLVWDHQSILTSRQLLVCKHWYYHLSFCIIIYKYILVELWKADIRVLVATPLSFHTYHIYNLPKSTFRNGAHPFLLGECAFARFSDPISFLMKTPIDRPSLSVKTDTKRPLLHSINPNALRQVLLHPAGKAECSNCRVTHTLVPWPER